MMQSAINSKRKRPSGFFPPSHSPRHVPGPTLMPLREVLTSIESARTEARSHGVDLCIFACTEARTAAALSADTDSRDLKFLSGSRTRDGLHAYCGGIEPAIDRALHYASYAEVVCYESATVDLAEAAQFAAAIHASYPGKRLGFGHAPRPNGAGWNELQHEVFAAKLRMLGFDYYFVRQFGVSVFPVNPLTTPSLLIRDVFLND